MLYCGAIIIAPATGSIEDTDALIVTLQEEIDRNCEYIRGGREGGREGENKD